MTSPAKKHFDVLNFVKNSKALGVTEALAEYQARQFEQVIDIASDNTKEEFNVRELATKSDIAETKADIAALAAATKSDIAALAAATKSDIAALAAATKADIVQLGTEIKRLESATKADIQELRMASKADTQALRYDSLKFIIWTGVGVVVSLSGIVGGLLAKGFHWFG